MTGEGLVNLKGMNKLTHLVLPDAALLADGDLANLSGMTALETLHLDTPGVTDAGMVNLKYMVNLKQLRSGPAW